MSKTQEQNNRPKVAETIRPAEVFYLSGKGKGDIRSEIKRTADYVAMMADDWPQNQSSYNKWAVDKMKGLLEKIAGDLKVRLDTPKDAE